MTVTYRVGDTRDLVRTLADGSVSLVGVVLDPFAGTGTTLAVAHLRGRDAIGFDLDERNRDLYPRRLAEVRRALHRTPLAPIGQRALFADPAEAVS